MIYLYKRADTTPENMLQLGQKKNSVMKQLICRWTDMQECVRTCLCCCSHKNTVQSVSHSIHLYKTNFYMFGHVSVRPFVCLLLHLCRSGHSLVFNAKVCRHRLVLLFHLLNTQNCCLSTVCNLYLIHQRKDKKQQLKPLNSSGNNCRNVTGMRE